jgi:ABC-type transport system involved in cytochrome bd biosynthesis fused ATPase/permease subunit
MPSLVSQSIAIASPIAASDTSIAISVLAALYLIVVGPVLAACFYAIRRKDGGAVERAATDVQRFIDLRERARAELAATGSLDRFIEQKHEARKHLWRPATTTGAEAARTKALPAGERAAPAHPRRARLTAPSPARSKFG